jgi:polar amino acid transport system substrate-binding protein
MIAVLLGLPLFSVTETVRADEKPEKRPLLWGADAEGGMPYVFADPKKPDEYIGFEMDIVNALAKELGREIKLKQYDFRNLVEGLNRDDFDFAMNGLEITPDRQEQVLFSRPYFSYRLQLAVRKDEERFDSLTGIKKVEGTVGTLENTAAERYLKKRGINTRTFEEQQNPYLELRQGQIDGVLMDYPIALYVAKLNPFNQKPPDVRFVGHIIGRGSYAIAVKKGNEELKRQLDEALTRLQEQGKLREIYEKWNLWQDDYLPDGVFREFDEEEDIVEYGAMNFGDILVLLLEGAWMTVRLTACGFLLAVAIGLPVALVRLYAPPPLNWLAVIYVEFFRGLPVLLILVFLYFGLPQMGEAYGLGNTLKLNAFVAAVLGFGLNYAAYESEIYRAGITSVPRGQWEAAHSLGMSNTVTFRRIILPQALRVVLPPTTNDLVAMFKDTSVVSVIAVVELTKQYQILIRSGSGHLLEIALATAGLYLVMSVPLGLLSRYLEKRWGKRE